MYPVPTHSRAHFVAVVEKWSSVDSIIEPPSLLISFRKNLMTMTSHAEQEDR